MQLIPFLEDNKVQGNSGSERTYYIPQDTVVDVSFYGSTYKVKPLYEFESEKLKNVSYTFSDLSELNNDEFLEKLSQDFGAYEEKSIDAPSGDKIYQYDWVKETTKCTYSATFFEEQLTVVSINVMKLD